MERSWRKYFGELAESFPKTSEISLEAQFGENQNKNIPTETLKIFDEFSASYRQTAVDSYLSMYPTILLPHFSQVYFSKHGKIWWLLNWGPYGFWEVHTATAMDGPRTDQSNREFQPFYTIFMCIWLNIFYHEFMSSLSL